MQSVRAIGRSASIPSTLAPGRPFAANADALDEVLGGQGYGARDADAFVGRHHRHRCRGQPHQQQRHDQRRPAADAVAEVSENGANLARDEADRIDRKRLQCFDPWVGVQKKRLRETRLVTML